MSNDKSKTTVAFSSPFLSLVVRGEHNYLVPPVQNTLFHSIYGSGFQGAISNLNSTALGDESQEIMRQVNQLRNPISPSGVMLSDQGDRTLEERLFDATANVKILTSQVAMHLDQELRKRIFSQLDAIHNVEDWDPDDEPIRKGSFATFLKALVEIKPVRRPSLGLSHSGHLIAAWVVEQDRLTIEFLNDDRVRWVLARAIDDDVERFAGHTNVARLLDGLKPYQPAHWFN